MKFAIIKERKNPPDRRVVFSPEACKKLAETFPGFHIKVERSDIRVFTDDAYRAAGIEVTDDVSDCDVLLGVKEVPIEDLIPNKKYFFFSHTFKKQPYNRKLLQAVLTKNIQLFDHETLTDQKGNRVVAFGRYAGIVGAYNGFRALGLKRNAFRLPKAASLINQQALIDELKKITLPTIKIVVTGTGRVGQGAKEMLDAMGLLKVSASDYLNETYDEPVYTMLDVLDYNTRIDGKELDRFDFFNNPKDYKSNFMRFAQVSDFYLACHYWDDAAPFIFSREDAKSSDFNIQVVADISCDIDGPVASTIRPSTIADPIYGYNPQTEDEDDFNKDGVIAVMAVDNLPCELPNDASVGFGNMFAEHVIPAFFNNDATGILNRAMMTSKGELTPQFTYLQDYVDGKE